MQNTPVRKSLHLGRMDFRQRETDVICLSQTWRVNRSAALLLRKHRNTPIQRGIEAWTMPGPATQGGHEEKGSGMHWLCMEGGQEPGMKGPYNCQLRESLNKTWTKKKTVRVGK